MRWLLLAVLLVVGLTFASEPSWANDLRAAPQTCTDPPPASPAKERAKHTIGARPRTRKRRRSSLLRMLGLLGDESADDAPFKLPKLSLADTLVGVFGIMIFGLVLGASI